MDKKERQKAVNERFVEVSNFLIQREGLDSDNLYAKKLDLHKQSFSDMKAGKVKVGTGTISKLLTLFPDINPSWLLTGRGPMLLEAEKEASVAAEPALKYSTAPAPIYTLPEREDGRQNVLLIDKEAAAGFPAHVNNPEWLGERPQFALPRQLVGVGDFYCLQVRGASMEPTIFNNDFLVARKLYDWWKEGVRDHYVHIVVRSDGVQAKRVSLNRERMDVVIRSDAPGYPTETLAPDEVIGLFEVKLRLTAQFPNQQAVFANGLSDLEDRMATMEEEVKRLRGE